MQGEFSNPPSRLRPRYRIGGLLLLVLLGVLSREWVLRRSEPRYLGRTEREWFPVWSQRAFPGASLTNAPPAALPMLLAAMRRPDSPWVRSWNGIAGRFSDTPGISLRGADAWEVRYFATFALLHSAARADFAEAMMGRFDSLPISEREAIIQYAGRDEVPMGTILQLSPLLIRILNGSDDRFALIAGHALARNPALARPHAARLVAVLAAWMQKASKEERAPRDNLARIGDLGPLSPAAVQPLVSLVDSKRIWKQTPLLLALSRLDPEHFPSDRFLASAPDPANRRERVVVLGLLLNDVLRKPVPPADFGVWVEQFLSFEGFDEPAGDVSGNRFVDQFKVLYLLHQISRQSRISPEVQRALLRGVRNPSPYIRRASATVLAQVRSPAPNAVDRAAILLSEGWEPAFMLQVLVNARMIPSSVDGIVRELASGVTPTGWTPKSSLSPEQSRRVVLRPSSGSLRAIASDLLHRVEESRPSGISQ